VTDLHIAAGTKVWPVKGKIGAAYDRLWCAGPVTLNKPVKPKDLHPIVAGNRKFSRFVQMNLERDANYMVAYFHKPKSDPNDPVNVVIYGFVVNTATRKRR